MTVTGLPARRTSAAGLEVRAAIRAALADVSAGATVLVACSGGADSVALATHTVVVGRRAGWRVGAITVDHGLQSDSAPRARAVAATLVRLGLDPVEAWHGVVDNTGSGPEGEARHLRRRLIDAAAQRTDAAAILLGHTRDDQAETVLLGLARGSGARSLSGMRAVAGLIRRPLLDVPRAVVRATLPEGIAIWEDPHNADPAYARARVRHRVLPVLEAELGPGIAAALARTAGLLVADADALDAASEDAWPSAVVDTGGPVVIDVVAVLRLARAIRSRILRRAALAAGSPPTDLTASHVAAIEAMIATGRGGASVDLPGAVRVVRRGDRVTFTTTTG